MEFKSIYTYILVHIDMYHICMHACIYMYTSAYMYMKKEVFHYIDRPEFEPKLFSEKTLKMFR
jgi:DNA repair photolyase